MSEGLRLSVVPLTVPEGANIIVGIAHFIKTVEDLYEAVVTSVPGVKFGIAFCEASGPRLIRYEGNDDGLVKAAVENARKIGAGHVFVILIRDAWPINVVNAIKHVQEVLTILCATANPAQAIVAETEQGRALLGVVDGYTPLGVEGDKEKRERIELLRRIGYKKG